MEINARNAMMADLKARTDVLRGTFDYVAKRERLDEVNLELEILASGIIPRQPRHLAVSEPVSKL